MSKRKQEKSSDKNARVKVRNLPQQDREVKNSEAANVRGGGGMTGGVLGDKRDSTTYRPER